MTDAEVAQALWAQALRAIPESLWDELGDEKISQMTTLVIGAALGGLVRLEGYIPEVDNHDFAALSIGTMVLAQVKYAQELARQNHPSRKDLP